MKFETDEKSFRESYTKQFAVLKAGLNPVSKELHEMLAEKCQENRWLRCNGIPFEDDPFFEMDSPYAFDEIDDIEILEMFFDHGNWSIRQGVVFRDLVFIQQVNGGDEWWTLRKTQEGYKPFESITFSPMIKRNEFKHYIRSLCKPQQCIDEVES